MHTYLMPLSTIFLTPSKYTFIHTYTFIHSFIHTYIHSYIYTYIYLYDYIHTYIHRSPLQLFQVAFLAFVPIYLCQCTFALAITIISKWILMGRRLKGEYPWDQSSYCQRWQAYLTIEEIRRGERHKTGILDMIQGSQYLVWYFR